MSSAYGGGVPRSPQYVGRKIAVRDITKEFTDASAKLRQGQLVKDDFFTLFEAVGALEIMDPKMDSGLLIPEKDAAVDNFDPLQDMLPEEIIGIMDQLLSFEMAWHQGYGLSQTLFTSLHMYSLLTPYFRPLSAIVFVSKTDRPSEQVDPLVGNILRAFCLGIMKSCDSVIQEITSEHYYEEEDFVTQTFAQYMLNDFDHEDVIAEIRNAIDLLQQQDLPIDIKDALTRRLELRIHLLKAFDPLTPIQVIDKTPNWKGVMQSVEAINSTIHVGKPKPDVFSERVQRHLASSTPPIPMIKTSWEEAYPRFKRLAQDNLEAYRFITISNPSPLNIIRFAYDFSSRKPQPSAYSRAVMQGLLFKGGKVLVQKPHVDVLMEDLKSLVLVGDPVCDEKNWGIEVPSDPRFLAARLVDEFLGKALDEYINIPRMLLQNRCRTRRTFSQSIAILDGLQAEAEQADSQLHQLFPSSPSPVDPSFQFYPLAAWSYFHKLRIMEWTISLGLELEVYLPAELAITYRFLAFVAHIRREHLSHIDAFLRLRQRKYKKTGNTAVAEQIAKSQATLHSLTHQATLTAELASALSSLYALLNSLSRIPQPPKTDVYGNEALRWELRMKPFLPIGTPTLPSHTAIEAVTNLTSASSFSAVFTTITSRLNDAKAALAAIKTVTPEHGNYVGCEEAVKSETQGVLGTIVAAGLAVALVKKAVEGLGLQRVGDVEGKEEEVEKVLKVQSVDAKRWAVGWVVPKVGGV